MCDGVEMLTWTRCGPNKQVNPNTELYSGNCIQDACDPFVLLRYGVSSVTAKSEQAYSNRRRNVRPLSQDNLGSRVNGCIVHHFEEHAPLTPAMPISTI